MNSFGATGTNAHVVLEEYTGQQTAYDPDTVVIHSVDQPIPFFISTRDPNALKQLAKRYHDLMGVKHSSFMDICYSAAQHRSLFKHRLMLLANSKQQVIDSLDGYLKGNQVEGLMTGEATEQLPKIAFVCSGQGPQWYGMGCQLMACHSVFKDVVSEIDRIFKKMAGYSLKAEMQKDAATSRISETRIAQPMIMAVQIGLIHMWRSVGVHPAGFVGHSIGEVAAAYGAGALSLEQAVEVIFNRSKEQDRASGAGKMLVVGLSKQAAFSLIKRHKDSVSIAAINGPEMVTLSGDEAPLQCIAADLEKHCIFNKTLHVNVPFHSHHMEMLRDELLRGLSCLRSSEATSPLYSTVTGKRESGKHLDSEYWYRNVRETVYFTDTISVMLKDGFNTFILN